jgi:hypothetical protein
MSSSFRSRLATVAAIILTSIIAAHPAKADSYQITLLDITQDETFLGIDDRGDFAINDSNNANKCGESDPSNPCFEVFLIGQSPFFTTTAPVLAFDNGSKCSVALDASFGPPPSPVPGICNNGHEILGAGLIGVYDGPDKSDVIFGGTFDGGDINANGDAVFNDGFFNELIFARDLTTATPEPGSFILFGTGCLTMTGALRARAPRQCPGRKKTRVNRALKFHLNC